MGSSGCPYAVHVGSIWRPYGVHMGAHKGPLGVRMGPIWRPYGVHVPYGGFHMGPIRDYYGTITGPLWDHYGTITGPLRTNDKINTGPLGDHYGTIKRPLWDQYGTNLGPISNKFGNNTGPIWVMGHGPGPMGPSLSTGAHSPKPWAQGLFGRWVVWTLSLGVVRRSYFTIVVRSDHRGALFLLYHRGGCRISSIRRYRRRLLEASTGRQVSTR